MEKPAKIKRFDFIWTARMGACLVLAYDFSGKYKEKSSDKKNPVTA